MDAHYYNGDYACEHPSAEDPAPEQAGAHEAARQGDLTRD